ncbi:phage terminase large subunit [Hyphomonas sp.]|uniref:phage terminase large subunit n=1 Tax=Hyphomonas sp. TaxID=87 RepID=UPI000C8E99DB|nr:phage terminase large subunit [Hyphomonas sp.]MAL42780.1 hypothetical protein [Hyphomonas sp.]
MDQEIKDWEKNPHLYLQDKDGNFVLKKDGTPRKKGGRPNTAEQAKLAAQRTVSRKQKNIQKLEQKLKNAKTSLKKQKTTLENIGSGEQTLVTDSDISALPKAVQEDLKDANVLFHPNEGPQTDFLAADEKDVLYGGAAGGGKSYAMLVDPLRYAHKKAHRALILRRSMPELREMIDKSRELYPQAFPGAKFREVEKLWNFPSGAKIEFGFLERDADVYRYQGQAYSWIGFDEITHLPTEFSWNYLASRLRTTDPEIKTYLRCTANPGGVGSSWVKKRYIEPEEYNKSFIGTDGLTRKFIPAKLADNPYLSEDGVYEQMLNSLPPIQRRQLLEGNWDVAEGAAFVEFDPDAHIITPFEIPLSWERVKGIDYGYASESCCLWGTIDMNDGTLIIYRELYKKGLTGEELGSIITDMEMVDPFSVNGVLDTAAWARTGTTGPTVGEALIKAGHKLRRADKNRIQGKIQIHEYLKVRESGRPKLQIFNTCPNLIRELQSIPLSKTNPEDVDTHASDHAYDALRYMIMSRPRMDSPLERLRGIKRDIFKPSDSTFGY